MNSEYSPLVSIITITHNRANLIHRCIESIQKQTYTNYEHIIIDGASTDNTEEIVKSYQVCKINK
jgi:glycosyltransferase involved in cell wall biosynthesis